MLPVTDLVTVIARLPGRRYGFIPNAVFQIGATNANNANFANLRGGANNANYANHGGCNPR